MVGTSSSVRAASCSEVRAESLRLDEFSRSPEDVELPVGADASHVRRLVSVMVDPMHALAAARRIEVRIDNIS
jgi:hypothetical protein